MLAAAVVGAVEVAAGRITGGPVNPTHPPVLRHCQLFSDTASRTGAERSELLNAAAEDNIHGREPVSSGTDTVAEYRSSGGDTILGEYQKACDEQPD